MIHMKGLKPPVIGASGRVDLNGLAFVGEDIKVDDEGNVVVDGVTQIGVQLMRPLAVITLCTVEWLDVIGQDAVGDGPRRLMRAMRGLPQ